MAGKRKKVTIAQIEQKEAELRKQKSILIEQEMTEKVIPMLKTFIGRYFAYRGNSYGQDYSKWDEFYRVLDFIGDSFIVENFHIDCFGEALIKVERKHIYCDGRKPFDGDCEEEITPEEYNKKRFEVFSEIAEPIKLRKYLIKES